MEQAALRGLAATRGAAEPQVREGAAGPAAQEGPEARAASAETAALAALAARVALAALAALAEMPARVVAAAAIRTRSPSMAGFTSTAAAWGSRTRWSS